MKAPPRLLLLAAFVVAATLTAQGRVLAQQEPFLTANYVAKAPVDDPTASVWAQAPASEVPLIPQVGFMPALREATVAKVTVRALHDGKDLAVLLEWQDPTRNVVTGRPDAFRDAAAIMLPVTEAVPNICMGAAGQITNLWHWKADWQEDIDKGFQDVVDHYPNFYKDSYPLVNPEGKPPFRMPQDFDSPGAKSFIGGWSAGNPLSQPVKDSPVEELTAAGFGTATHLTKPHADETRPRVFGNGQWANGTWRVVFSRALRSADPDSPDLSARTETPIAFAVWNGANQEVGARKQLSSFQTLALGEVPAGQVAAAAPGATPAWMWAGLGVAFIIVLGTMWLAVRPQPGVRR